jgi:cell division septation protein DedD
VNTLYTRNQDFEEDGREPAGRDREVTLGASFIVGIFFALVLICAIFFAFGYSLGKRSVLPAAGIPNPAGVSSSGIAKPASGISEAQTDSSEKATEEQTSQEDKAPAVVLPAKLAIKPTPASSAAAPSVTASNAALPVVQVAAVSRQGDAAMLLSALKRKGYNAAIHQVSQDKLLHVQIGPFATKKDADDMRKRLISDGYNAIVK